jgi:hypothetical protein
VFRLTPNSNGSWTEKVLHSFCALTNCADGESPTAGLIFDQAGNLDGTTRLGGDISCDVGYGCGVVFKLVPNSNGEWRETVLQYLRSRSGSQSLGCHDLRRSRESLWDDSLFGV